MNNDSWGDIDLPNLLLTWSPFDLHWSPNRRFLINRFPNEWQRFVNSENDGWGSRDLFILWFCRYRRYKILLIVDDKFHDDSSRQ